MFLTWNHYSNGLFTAFLLVLLIFIFTSDIVNESGNRDSSHVNVSNLSILNIGFNHKLFVYISLNDYFRRIISFRRI